VLKRRRGGDAGPVADGDAPEAGSGDRPPAGSRLHRADVVLLVLGLLLGGAGLAAIALDDSPTCKTRTTTETTFGANPARQAASKQTEVKECEPAKATAGFPQAALVVALVLVLPAISRRVADDFEATTPLGGVKKGGASAALAAAAANQTKADELADPALPADEPSEQAP
jgi:hypothetical protein